MILLILNILLSPWTKVEESFNTQAVHDFIFTRNLTEWDHFAFPGVVPRTFTGPLVLSVLGLPIFLILGVLNASKVSYLIWTRIILACLTWISSFGFYSVDYFFMELGSFHMNFWGSRTLPNTFANILTNLAFLFRTRRGSRNGLISLSLFVFTAVVLRAEVAVLGGLVILSDLYYKKYTIRQALKIFTLCFLSSLIWTLSLDSYLWQKPFHWPQLHVFLFNTWQNGSKNYGTSPWYTYFLKMLPKIAPLAYPLSILAFFSKDSRHKRMTAPIFLYIFIYSFLPHKEWRFIMYAITPLQASASIFVSSFSKWPKRIFKLFVLILFVLSLIAMGISSLNYPGGIALSRVPLGKSIYIDTFTAMNGASRFGQKFPCKPWLFKQNCGSIKTQIESKEGFCSLIAHQKSEFMCPVPLKSLEIFSNDNHFSQIYKQEDLFENEVITVYDKNETQNDFSSYTYILTNEPEKFKDRKVHDVIYGYDGLGYVNITLYRGLMIDLHSVKNLSWSKIVGPIRFVPKVWIME